MTAGILFALESGTSAVVLCGLGYVALVRPWMRQEGKANEAQRERLQKEHELTVNAAVLDSRREVLEAKEKFEQEYRQREGSLEKLEERLAAKDDSIESRRESLQERENLVLTEQRALAEHRAAVERRAAQIQDELQRVARMGKDQAKEQLLREVETEVRDALAERAKLAEQGAFQDAERRAKHLLLDVMQRHTVEYVTEATIAVVELPSEDMKGRLIGRDGRNIRAFEQVTGVDLIIDETPEAVVISSFDPIRRETARLALMNLMLDGRIHPGRIEELYEAAQAEVVRITRESGERAAERADVPGLSPRAIEAMGRLRFRTSYAQNVLDHSVEVSHIAAGLAAELGFNVEVAKRAGFLHDIGKALPEEWDGPHAIAGMNYLKEAGEKESVLLAVGAHHHEIEPTSAEAILVIIADTVSAVRPGARRESLENYMKRLTSLEAIANSFPGVERSYAVQAGREIRLIVKPEDIDDLGAGRLARDVARRIEAELEFPGQIKVTVIRETRVQEIAK
jgi:ribonuclease Y